MTRNTVLLAGIMALSTATFARQPHHEIFASIQHETSRITVLDTIIFPPGSLKEGVPLEFTLNSHLTLREEDQEISVQKIETGEEHGATSYRIVLDPDISKELRIPLSYAGVIREEIKAGATEYARGFSETDGIISPEGIYLAGSTKWLPAFKNTALFTFNLTVELDGPWNVVTQGTRTKNQVASGRRTVRYSSPDPVDEVYLVAGKWTEYSLQSDDVLVQAFLRTPDESLANRYLGVTSHYLKLYQNLIGDYPYSKFALVENFWETGYGMPSFTLLGEKVIRFPWILHSSYPHELLHNYWGNSVYVDYSQGNWCEGITVYMADHLIKEQQGLATDYRRNTLQKFTDYVNEENDFPPSAFINRNNPAEEAIGYGKVMMFNNMLRDEFGDELFIRAYSDFYRKNKFRFATYDDIRSSFEAVTNKDLAPMFDQWINRTGAPSLELSDVEVTRSGQQYRLTFNLKQVQPGNPFQLSVPVGIYLEGRDTVEFTRISMEGSETSFTGKFNTRPLKVSVDPRFNLMRTLDRSEVPATLSQLFGAKSAMIILPAYSKISADYLAVAQFWKQTQAAQDKEIMIVYDTAINKIPANRPVWIMGYENSYAGLVSIGDQYNDLLSPEANEKIQALTGENSLVYAVPNSRNPDQTLGFLATGSPAALRGLSRKLFHYGSYGYLGFEGDAPDNVLKGVFPVLNSRMEYVIPYSDNPEITQQLPERKALTTMK